MSQKSVCLDLIDRGASCFPLYLADVFTTGSAEEREFNISDLSEMYCRVHNVDFKPVYFSLLSLLHSPHYAVENADALQLDWPRIPLPATKELLLKSAELGKQVAALLDPETAVPHVTTGKLKAELQPFGRLQTASGNPPDETTDFALTAGWGHYGAGTSVMPGGGKVRESATAIPPHLQPLLGEKAFDIYLNDNACWSCVPEKVWEYTLGGYQVIKKWLSYRDQRVLNRHLKPDEVAYVSEMARRIAALLLLGPELDANYRAVKDNTVE